LPSGALPSILPEFGHAVFANPRSCMCVLIAWLPILSDLPLPGPQLTKLSKWSFQFDPFVLVVAIPEPLLRAIHTP